MSKIDEWTKSDERKQCLKLWIKIDALDEEIETLQKERDELREQDKQLKEDWGNK